MRLALSDLVEDKAPAKKKVHAKPTLKKGQPFAALSKSNVKRAAVAKPIGAKPGMTKAVVRPTKQQEMQRKQKLQEQKNFEERMMAPQLKKQATAAAPAFVMAPATFSFPGATTANPFASAFAPPPSAIEAFMQPLAAVNTTPVPAPVRVQKQVQRPTNVFEALQDEPEDQPPPMLFQMKPASFQLPAAFDPDL
ncbi:hypothetical protein ACHHYP_01540 [Achlya hypogyna]|uniref:Uncharacterized protein n=1 Tax=Achlya hypogyna TaxID=1202772 RepID=A0A1V9Z8B5_ACHHY|nr:hypothetical protein ACHHYP_01540 [Achlya hypogyna]